MIADIAVTLCEEARSVNERRMLVLAGDHDKTITSAKAAIRAIDVDPSEFIFVGPETQAFDAISPHHTRELLGTTHTVVVFDAHTGLYPNALGRVIGTVNGGGLFVLLTPPFDSWAAHRDSFDETLAVPPYSVDEVTTHFKTRFIDTIDAHPGIAIVDVDTSEVTNDGLTHPAPRAPTRSPTIPDSTVFPRPAYERCLTTDQVTTLTALETLQAPGHAVVVEADRGRGKSSVAGLAAGALASTGDEVVVTAPSKASTRELFARATELLTELDQLTDTGPDDRTTRIESRNGGSVQYVPPPDVLTRDPDVLFVDEAAAIAVPVLSELLDIRRLAFTTTIHGYEGAGRGFSVRFRDKLTDSGLAVIDRTLTEPIRYTAGDPLEIWAFRALLLNATPPVSQLVSNAQPDTVTYRSLDPSTLIADEHLLRETFGLLVLAHYRTEPDDLVRLLDAPNIETRALLHDGHIVSVALLAHEGGLSPRRRKHMYEGGRIRGNMLPDILTSQLRDESAGATTGIRIMRIATHASVRSRGLGSRLLSHIRTEFDNVDWLGTGYGAMPDLISFWAQNDYSTIHLSTTRNATSGEHSVIMQLPRSPAGQNLHDRHAAWFADRIGGMLTDTLRDLHPDIVVAALHAASTSVALELSDDDWRLLATTAYGPGLYDVDPDPFRQLAIKHFVDPIDDSILSTRQQHLLVTRVLQARPWTEVADTLGFPSRRECMRALGTAFQGLVDAYGNDAAIAERDRFSH